VKNPTITFSHDYPKLHKQTSAELVAVKLLTLPEDMNGDLHEYDTAYYDDNGQKQHYRLNSGEYLQLILYGNKRIPFCTIRNRYGRHGDKLSYYLSCLGKIFEIEVKNENQ
jgi:hypothetical protein